MGQVPMLFDKLVEAMVEDANVRAAIGNLLARKRAGDELDRGPKLEVLSRFIDSELARLEKIQPMEDSAPDPAALNSFFQSYCLMSPYLELACSR
jgi:predicted nucleotidyltransferase